MILSLYIEKMKMLVDRDNIQDSWPTNTGICAQLAGASLSPCYRAVCMYKVL